MKQKKLPTMKILNCLMRAWRDDSMVRTLLILQKTWIQFPAPTWYLITMCNSSSRRSNGFFCPLRAPVTHMAQIHITGRQTLIPKKNNDEKVKEHTRRWEDEKTLCDHGSEELNCEDGKCSKNNPQIQCNFDKKIQDHSSHT